MALTNLVRKFTKPHGSGNNSGSKTIINVGTGGNTNYNSDFLDVKSINAVSGDINNLKSRNFQSDNIEADYINTRKISANTIVGQAGTINNGSISNLDSNEISTNTINVDDTATVNNLISNYIQSKNIVTDDLTVNKSAHFFELIIDKIDSVGGTIMNTVTNSLLDFVEGYDSQGDRQPLTDTSVVEYRCYWRKKNAEGKEINNDWKVNDQAICQSFNVTSTTSVRNKYYWRLVKAIDNGNKKYVNLNNEYTYYTTDKPKVSDSPIHYWVEFSGISYADGANTFNNLIVEPYGNSIYSNDILTVNNIGDGIKIYYEDNVLINGTFSFATDTYTKLNIIVVYEDGSLDYVNPTGYATTYSYATETDKAISYILVTTETVETWEECNWIDLGNAANEQDISSAAGSDSSIYHFPDAGDMICQLGYRYGASPTADDKARASAIIIASYDTPDAGVVPPSYAQYQDIVDFSLDNHRKTYFDATGAHVVGEFTVDAGGGSYVPLDQYIQSQTSANEMDLYVTGNYDTTGLLLVVLQTDSNTPDSIYDMNNFPNSIQIVGRLNGIPVLDQSKYTSLTVNVFGENYDLLNFSPGTNQGIYISSMTSLQQSMRYFDLNFSYRGTAAQTVNSGSIKISATIVNNGNTYNATYNIPISIVEGTQGQNAEVWKLYKDTENTEVIGTTGKLYYLLRYGLTHIVGTRGTVSPPESGMYITADFYNNTNNIVDSYVAYDFDWTSGGGKSGGGYWEFNGTTPTNWWSEPVQDRPIYIVVQLFNANNELLDNTVVNIQLQDTSFFTVKEGLMQSIQSNTTAIGTANGNITTLQTDYTTLSQSVNNINLTVGQNTADISNLTTSVGQIDIKADNIDLRVTQTNNDLSDLETGISNTGINISNHTITLDADNTIIDGDLSLKGDFTSENDESLNKVTIFTDDSNGDEVGINLYGPSAIDQQTGEPLIGANQENIVKIGFDNDSQYGGRYGFIKLLSAGNQNINSELNEQELILTDQYSRLIIDNESVQLYEKVNNNWQIVKSKRWYDILS